MQMQYLSSSLKRKSFFFLSEGKESSQISLNIQVHPRWREDTCVVGTQDLWWL